MLNLLIFLTAPLCITSYDTKEEFFNLREHNYCDLRCYETKTKFKVNVACGCEKVTPRLGLKVLNSTFGFREAILDKLNQFRNKIASGSTDMPAGADMMVLNYDVGLEYSAACILKRAQSAGMDLCTRNKNHEALGNFPVMLMPEDKSWMINNIADAMAFLDQKLDDCLQTLNPEQMDKTGQDPYLENELQFCFQLIFSKHFKIGCARSVEPGQSVGRRMRIYCLLASWEGSVAAYRPGVQLYSKGPGCSECPSPYFWELDDPECNKQYTSLCGKLAPVPTYYWKDAPQAVPDPWVVYPENSTATQNGVFTTLPAVCGLLVLLHPGNQV